MGNLTNVDDPRLPAAIELIGRTGATSIRIGYSTDDEGPPTVWYTVATWATGRGGRSEASAGLDPVTATLRLCAEIIDGGTCRHCQRPTAFVPEVDDLNDLLTVICCRYAWDPELSTFRRDCEGEDDAA